MNIDADTINKMVGNLTQTLMTFCTMDDEVFGWRDNALPSSRLLPFFTTTSAFLGLAVSCVHL